MPNTQVDRMGERRYGLEKSMEPVDGRIGRKDKRTFILGKVIGQNWVSLYVETALGKEQVKITLVGGVKLWHRGEKN